MTEDAFARRFYADRAELDSLGIHLTVDRPADGFSEQENYSLAPEAFFLPSIAFSDAELAAMQTALSLLDGEFAYAEPLRLALQQLTWGRPSPLGSPAQRAIGLGITGSAPAARSSPPAWPRSTPPSTAASGSSSSTSRSAAARPACARSTRTSCSSRAGSSTSSAGRTSAARSASSASRGSAGKVAYATKAEHDFQRPDDFDPRDYANRIPWQLGDPVATAEIHVSDRIAWHVERNFGRYGTLAPADDGGQVFRTEYAIARLVLAWALGYEQHVQVLGPPELVDELGRRLERVAELHRGEPFTSVAAGRPPRDPDEERETPARQREPAGIRPERFARLVTLASVLIQAGRRGERLQVTGGLRAAADLAPGAARGRRRAQRRQLRRRRLRALRRGPAHRRDRGRPRALLGHVRPPGAPAADRGPRAARRDRAARRPPLRAPARPPATSSSARWATSPRRACWSPTRARTTRSRARSARRSRRAA